MTKQKQYQAFKVNKIPAQLLPAFTTQFILGNPGGRHNAINLTLFSYRLNNAPKEYYKQKLYILYSIKHTESTGMIEYISLALKSIRHHEFQVY
jgi:hypothetical protein